MSSFQANMATLGGKMLGMTNNGWSALRLLGLVSFQVLGAIASAVLQTFALTNCARAQIIPDATLPQNSIVTPQGNTFNINGGTRAGSNLFHSFSEFSVPDNSTAVFNNAGDIQNIISRVTGGSSSKIDGLITANGTANLFLINPSGIIFGPNANIYIGGSFVASTASSLKFADGTQFFATPSPTTPLLTISVPVGLQYGANPQAIVNKSQFSAGGVTYGLDVMSGRTLALVGGDVKLDGGILSAPGGRVELGGLKEAGTVGLEVNGSSLSLNFPSDVARSNVSLTNNSEVKVASSNGGGSIALNAQDINILGNSGLRAGISLLGENNNAQAGDVRLNATGTVKIENSFIYNAVFGGGNGGSIRIDTNQLMIQDGLIATATFFQGAAGDVFVNARNSVDLSGSTTSNGTFPLPIDDALKNRFPAPIGLFSASLDVNDVLRSLDASDVRILNTFLASSSLESGGDAGNLTIDTGRLTVRDGAVVSASTTSAGRGGNLTVKANSVELSGTSSVDTPQGTLLSVAGRVPSGLQNSTRGFGIGGDLTINTEQLVIRDGAWVITGTSGEKPSGELRVHAKESVRLSGTSSANRLPSVLASGTQGSGNAGTLSINTRQLIVSDGAIVSAGTSNFGKGGDLIVNATDSVQLIGTSTQGLSQEVLQQLIGTVGASSVFAILGEQAFPGGLINGTAGNEDAGNLTINTERLLIQNGAQASVSTVAGGDAGKLTVRASAVDLIGASPSLNPNDVVGPSLLSSATGRNSTGKGGNIDITTDSLSLDNNARISASTAGQGDAGSINLEATENVSLDNNSQIRSTVESTALGNAQEISIKGRSLSLANGAQINTETQGLGKAGNITLNITEDITLSGRNTGIFASTRDSLIERSIFFTENGDAGQLLGTVQDLTLQPGFYVTTISGNLRNNFDVDLYKIFLSGGQTFSASTFGGANFDTQLFLFDANGRGVYANDDSPGIRQSTLPAADRLTPTERGFYYLGISSYDNDPQSANGRIFALGDFTVAPTGPGKDLPLTNWDNRGFGGSGDYTITLKGTAASQLVLQPSGAGGDITVGARSLFATSGAQVAASTSGQGNAGNVNINTSENVFLDGQGSGVFANTAPNLTSKAGDLTIDTNTLQVQNQARVTVSSPQGQAGNLTVTANTVRLNQGSLTAETGISSNEEGANINLQGLDLLFMQNQSLISAQAFNNARGGNINIDATKGFVIAALGQNNDIIANAFQGQGGTINIATQRIFGLEERKANPPNTTNDIDASSEFSTPGTVTLNTLYIDPSRGLVQLPTNLVDASTQIATGCTHGSRQRANSFVATGRGGIAPSPNEPLMGDAVLADWISLDGEKVGQGGRGTQEQRKYLPHSQTPSSPIVEATGWVVDADGSVVLVANAPTTNPQSSWLNPTSCNSPS